MRKRKNDTTPFDRNATPPKQLPLLMPLIWLVCWVATRFYRLKIRRRGMKRLKPPYLVVATHLSFMDYFVTPLALFPHRANYVSDLEGFEHYGEWLYRRIGCLGTRKFIPDTALVRNIQKVINRKGIIVLYPEARHTNVGTQSVIPQSIGKLAKRLGVPVVALNMHGNYLQAPIWNPKGRSGVRLESELLQLLSAEDVQALSAADIHQRIQEALAYDEYAWQRQTGMRISDPHRAEGLEWALYQCPICTEEFRMRSGGADIYCGACNARWRMDELGGLQSDAERFSHIPDWYEWQRAQVAQEVEEGRYALDIRVRIEALPNAKGFLDLGEGRLVHRQDGFQLTLTEFGAREGTTLRFSPLSTQSIPTECDFRGKGQCVVLSTPDNTYYLYPLEPGFNANRIQFATEYLYERAGGR